LEVDSLELDNEDSHVQTLEKTKLAPPSCMYYVNGCLSKIKSMLCANCAYTDGVYGSFNCIIFDHASVKAVPLCNQYGSEFPEHSELRSCSIWGPTCDAMDCILKDALLPEMEVGDWILFPNMGAYTTAAASTFNGMEAPDVVYVDSRFAVEYA
jgi:diaminopimelate decarboxylase